jgi:chromosome partitioning protein
MAHVDPVTGDPREMSHYARLVQRARTERLAIDGRTIDWILVRNRISMLSSRSMRLVQSAIEKIAVRLGSRVAEGIAERVIFRSLFPMGLTVFDPLDEELLGGLPSMSHLSARQEYRQLLEALRLPVSERTAARKAAEAAFSQGEAAAPKFEHMANSN